MSCDNNGFEHRSADPDGRTGVRFQKGEFLIELFLMITSVRLKPVKGGTFSCFSHSTTDSKEEICDSLTVKL